MVAEAPRRRWAASPPGLLGHHGGSYVPTMYSARADMAAPAMAVPTPIEPGTLDIVANVTVVFRLDPRK